MNSQDNNTRYNDSNRLEQEIDRVDELKHDLSRLNEQLSFDIQKKKRDMENLLSSNLLSAKEHEMILESRERIMKIERDKEEEFDFHMRNLDNSKEEYLESKNKLDLESEENDDR